MQKGKIFLYPAAIIIAALAYFLLGYHTERSNFPQLLVLVVLSSICSFLINQKSKTTNDILWIGLAFRAVLIFAIPFFSQDFYRFIWDGELILKSINPYSFTPNELMANTTISFPNKALLFEKMGSLSAKYNSNYPPVNQIFFAAAAWIGATSFFAKVLVLKLFIVMADVGIFFVGKKLLQHFKMDEKRIAFYFLNPLVIIELTGNLHFEGVMLFFCLVGIWFLLQKKIILSASFVGLAIATKLVPLMLLPFFIKKMSIKNNLTFFATLATMGAAFFYACFGLNNISHYLSTIALWFNNFEFNASIYYLLKEIGFAISGYNMIAVFGKLLAALSIITILGLSFLDYKRKGNNFFPFLCLALTAYLFFSTTVHPWYLVTLIGLSIFTDFKFILWWSISIFISYAAYAVNGFNEKGFALLIEYVPVYIIAFVEIKAFVKKLNARATIER